MSQMTDDMARRIIANWEATKNHYGITAWEECQLAYRWLHHGEAIRAAVAAERERCAKYHDALALSYHDTRILLLSRPNREEDASIAYRMAQCHEESAAAIRRGE